jgi:trimeric autotransporter adhesin
MKASIQCKKGILSTFIIVALTCFGVLPKTQAVLPPPDGGYPGGNTAEGQNALRNLTSGGFNAAVGWLSLRTLTTGNFNTGIGAGTLALNIADENTATGTGALLFNTTGFQNTATGAFALFNNDTGSFNTANGFQALFSNTEGLSNTAVGVQALQNNINGSDNTATGILALANNTAGQLNTANGASALQSNTTGNGNTATGFSALLSNTAGSNNTATGFAALQSSTTAEGNTAVGYKALQLNTTGERNTAIGYQVLINSTGTHNTATGHSAMSGDTTGSSNAAYGYNALASNLTGNGDTAIGYGALDAQMSGDFNIGLGLFAGNGVIMASNVICIGASGTDVNDSCYIGNIWMQPGGSQAVYVNSDGKLGAQVSSRRFKEDIHPMEEASATLYRLKPVTFRYKKAIDQGSTQQLGLVAEEVAVVNPDLVIRDKEGKPYSVRYDQVNAMLLNEFLKEHRKVQELEATVAQQQKSFQSSLEEQEKRIEVLASNLQKMSARIEMTGLAPQVVQIP